MSFSIHEAARVEFFESAAYYEAQKEGPAERFAREVAAAIIRIVQFPGSGSVIIGTTRRM